jgi:hypothetical protein
MSEIVYTPLAGKIEKYFSKIQEAGVPPKANRTWLKTTGFTSSNDHYLLKILNVLGFIDASNVPTELWKRYKNPTEAPAVLAKAIRTGYSDLFSLYPDANRKDREALYAYFSAKTGKAKATVDLMVSTFNYLCALADFEAETPPTVQPPDVVPSPISPPELRIVSGKGVVPEVHINIQLHLPPTTDPTVFDNLFKSMKKHLLSAEE